MTEMKPATLKTTNNGANLTDCFVKTISLMDGPLDGTARKWWAALPDNQSGSGNGRGVAGSETGARQNPE